MNTIEISKTALTPADKKRNLAKNYWMYATCTVFGVGTWLPVNAVYSQMPIFVQTAPEGWSLPSYFSILVQTANISPLICYIFRKKFANYQSFLIDCFLIVGVVAMLMLTFTHQIVTFVFNDSRSVYFFVFSFFISLIGCTSSVLFLPFMNKLPESYLIPYFMGEGISGLIPSFLALVQGVGKEPICSNVTLDNGTVIRIAETNTPLFSSTIFLIIMTFLMCLSTVSFQYLKRVSLITQNNMTLKRIEQFNKTSYQSQNLLNTVGVDNISILSTNVIIILLFLQMYVNFFSNGMLPSIQSYSCLPYGTIAYHWSINFNQIIGPVITYFAFFLPIFSIRVLTACCFVQFICLGFELLTAFTSPTPPLMGTSIGIFLIILVWVTGTGLNSYLKLSIAAVFRRRYQDGLINYGLVTQIGSALGSVITFFIVNNLKLLHSISKDNCS